MKNIMENELKKQTIAAQKTFYKYRGASACISAAISFVTDTFWKNIRLSWPVSLLFSLAITSITFIGSHWNYTWEKGESITKLTIAFATIFLSLTLFKSFVYVLVHMASIGRTAERLNIKQVFGRRYIKYCCRVLWTEAIKCAWCIGILGLMMWTLKLNVLGVALNLPIKIGLCVVLTLVFIAISVPLVQAGPHAVLMGGQPLRSYWIGIKRSWKAWGKVFSTQLLSTLLAVILILLFMMPALVFSNIEANASASRLSGDIVYLPNWFSTVEIIILLLSAILSTLILWLDVLSGAYLFATQKTDAEEEEAQRLPLI